LFFNGVINIQSLLMAIISAAIIYFAKLQKYF